MRQYSMSLSKEETRPFDRASLFHLSSFILFPTDLHRFEHELGQPGIDLVKVGLEALVGAVTFG